jgi:hypothetical protein
VENAKYDAIKRRVDLPGVFTANKISGSLGTLADDAG